MTSKKQAALLFIFLFVVPIAWGGIFLSHPQQAAEKIESSAPQQEEAPDKIVGAPQNIKQKTGIWVFVAWIWISVFVLIYFLRLKIAEADRLHRIRFYAIKKD